MQSERPSTVGFEMEHSLSFAAIDIAPRPTPRLAPVATEDRRFIALLNGYRSRGGLQRLATLQAARRQVWDAEVIENMPLGVAERRILGIAWNHEVWVPDFQFETRGAIKPAASAVFLELVPSHDPWALTAWFITPCPWLQDDRPVDLLDGAPARVVEAARAGPLRGEQGLRRVRVPYPP